MRERILIGARAKSGKTHTALDVIKNDMKAKCRFIECDDGIRRLIELQFPELACPVCKGRRADANGVVCKACNATGVDTKRITLSTVHTWPEFKLACDVVLADVKAGKLTAKDWIVLDSLDIIFQAQRSEFLNRVYSGTVNKTGEKLTSSWDAIINKRRGGGPVFEPSDWDPIYMEFESVLNPMLFETPCNVIATEGIVPLETEGKYKNQELIEFYRAFGMPVKFEGYKRVPRVFDTLITLDFDVNGRYFTVWGDRGSRGLEGKRIGERIKVNLGFYFDYLVQIAGVQ
jgi:hypothetical protein